jgi:hypothetical protein
MIVEAAGSAGLQGAGTAAAAAARFSDACFEAQTGSGGGEITE